VNPGEHDPQREGAARSGALDAGLGTLPGIAPMSEPGLRALGPRTRADFRRASGVLLVTRDPPPVVAVPGQPAAVPGNPAEGVEVLLALWDDGSATALHGHVDLGTGLRTALAQVVAEELGLPLGRVHLLMGHTASAPNQGATIASASLQIHAAPLRAAAAQARAWLLQAAAGEPIDPATMIRGRAPAPTHTAPAASDTAALAALVLPGRHVELMLDPATPTKDPAHYTVVGQPVPRVDIPAKVMGELVYVHDLRLPGMLHGRVVRPPYAGVDAGDFVGRTLEAVDEASIAHLPGIVRLVVEGDFIGIVAEREEQAEAAMHALAVRWKPWPGLAGLDDLGQALREQPATRRVLVDMGEVDAAIARAAQPMPRTYLWPYQLHASIGPPCAVAHWHAEPTGDGVRLSVWAGTQNPHVLRRDLALLVGLPDVAVDVVRMEAAGCYGRNGADDVAADAALLARAVGAPVRVQLTREQEHAWEPKGAAQAMTVNGGLNADGSVAGVDVEVAYPSNGAPTLALLLTGRVPAVAQAYEMGDRTAVPPYDYRALRVTARDMAPILRASWLRGVSALPNSFAHESYVDELAHAAGADPLDFRLGLLRDKDARAAELLQATAARAGWLPHRAPQQQPPEGDWLKGQGLAYARYVHSRFPGFGAAWAAWVADVEVHRVTGEVNVRRVVVGQDSGLMVNPAGVQHQVHGNVLQTTSRALKEQVRTEPDGPHRGAVATREWGSYPLLSFREVPVVEVLLMPRPGEPPLGAGESASVPGTAAIANAIFDATGVRLRQPPFTPEVVRAAMHAGASDVAGEGAGSPDRGGAPEPGALGGAGVVSSPSPAATSPPPEATLRRLLPAAPWPRGKRAWARAGALVGGLLGLAAAALGWRPAIAPVEVRATGVYAQALVERGRVLASAGDCAVCHTAPGGPPNAGGRAMETPFGTVFSTNLTPDPDTGLGRWSFSAFQRAMREGVSRDGHRLYPAFPYTAFTRMSDDDLLAVYAWLMAQPPVRAETPPTRLRAPYAWRPLMGLWNALYLTPGPRAADPPERTPEAARSAAWVRGEYLVNAVGHCGACHTPRDALGAERRGAAHFAGAVVDGWEAPALTALNPAPRPWTAATLYDYLRHGHSAEHGVALGPMAPVIAGLAPLPDADIRAMAEYLASFQRDAVATSSATATPPAPTARMAPVVPAAPLAVTAAATPLPGPADRLFDGACGACHGEAPVPGRFGLDIPLGLSSKLHAARPDNLLRVLLDGVQREGSATVGYMPGFRHALDDGQLAELAAHLRARHAPGQPAWTGLRATAARLRAEAPR
jgi:nicotinate dehydrogenase subunit B